MKTLNLDGQKRETRSERARKQVKRRCELITCSQEVCDHFCLSSHFSLKYSHESIANADSESHKGLNISKLIVIFFCTLFVFMLSNKLQHFQQEICSQRLYKMLCSSRCRGLSAWSQTHSLLLYGCYQTAHHDSFQLTARYLHTSPPVAMVIETGVSSDGANRRHQSGS